MARVKQQWTIGIDEVGRGSLAGPVVVAAVAIPQEFRIWHLESGRPNLKLKDSKKLSMKRREEWFEYIKNHPRIFYAIARVTPKVIDRINIANAANLAATRALQKLSSKLHVPSSKILLDGGLHLQKIPNSKLPACNRLRLKSMAGRQIPNSQTIIKGDEKYNCIKLASLVAKVSRDRYMAKNCHKRFSQYGFDVHKGYGTRMHFKALRRYGPSPIHRVTFI